MSKSLRIASVNVNGIRAAYRKGMGDWLESRGVDILAMQEVRANRKQVDELINDGWHLELEEASAAGRAGVAIASRTPLGEVRRGIGPEEFDSAGRWLEVDFEVEGKPLTVVSCYVHSGEADTPKQEEKWKFLDAMAERMAELRAERELAVIVGDLNVGHDERDIKNWKGNVKKSGFLPRERGYFTRMFTAFGETAEPVDGSGGVGLGWVDVGREQSGDVPGPYTWWSYRGKAFDTDAGWRIDYHVATPGLAQLASNYTIDRAAAYDERWSDHSPVVVDYQL